MASVTLAYTWVNLMATGEAIRGYTGRGRQHDRQRSGEVRQLAGGRFRAIGMAGTRRTQQFVIRDIPLGDVETLESWIGQTVLVRDNRKRRMFGVYWSVSYTDGMSPNFYDVQLNVTEVTFVEGEEDAA